MEFLPTLAERLSCAAQVIDAAQLIMLEGGIELLIDTLVAVLQGIAEC